MRALFIGRFQPFHNGHLADLRRISEEFDEVIVAIGSKQHSRTDDNPFSYEERKEMINTVGHANGLKNLNIIGIEDINCNGKYVAHVEKQIPKCDVVFSGNTIIQGLFKDAGYEVRVLPRLWDLSATHVREMMKKKEDWHHLVPEVVIKIIEK